MTLKQILIGTAAASGIMLASAAFPPFCSFLITGAQAANVAINISVGTFYDRLAPYGTWVSYHGRWVWAPENVGPRWRPYTVGHWVYTRHHGWLWVSNERFGWATYHYGRWGYGRDIGWYWVPGRRWAPAWVAWHRTDYDIAWAPLPPERDEGVSISISIGDVPDYYWQAVPAQAFLSINLSDHVIRDRDHVRRVITEGEPQTVVIENNIVVNNVIDINFIEQKTNKKVKIHEEKTADSPEAAGKADQNSVAIFNADLKEEPNATPQKVKKAEEVLKEREAKGIKIEEQSTDQGAPAQSTDQNAPVKTQADQQPVDQNNQQSVDQGNTKKKKPAADIGNATTQDTITPPKQGKTAPAITAVPQDNQPNADQQQNADQQPLKKKKKENAAETVVPQTDQQQNVDQQNADQQPLKKKKKENASETVVPQTDQQQNVDQQNADQQPLKKKKNAVDQQQNTEKALQAPSDQNAPAQTEPGQNADKASKKDKKIQQECDPAVEDCSVAQ